jgi:hypothetical protein
MHGSVSEIHLKSWRRIPRPLVSLSLGVDTRIILLAIMPQMMDTDSGVRFLLVVCGNRAVEDRAQLKIRGFGIELDGL